MHPIMSPMNIHMLRNAIPAHCFHKSYAPAFYYLFRNLVLLAVLLSLYPGLESTGLPSVLTTILLNAFSFSIGLVTTGLWILAHECGHGAFSPSQSLNDTIGFILHSYLLVPYFSWKITHRKHHHHAGHMDKDTAFVPRRVEEHNALALPDAIADVPVVAFAQLLLHQLFGWPLHMIFYVSAGSRSTPAPKTSSASRWRFSHLDPSSLLFCHKERVWVVLSDVGIISMLGLLWYLQRLLGSKTLFYTYWLPYLWTNHWIIAITYLHHTHPDVPRFENSSWSFAKGALSTVDRQFGMIGEHMFFNIIETHVVHHLFPHIPFWHAKEATAIIAPMLGENYHSDTTPLLVALWRTFRACVHVQEQETEHGSSGVRVWTHIKKS